MLKRGQNEGSEKQQGSELSGEVLLMLMFCLLVFWLQCREGYIGVTEASGEHCCRAPHTPALSPSQSNRPQTLHTNLPFKSH